MKIYCKKWQGVNYDLCLMPLYLLVVVNQAMEAAMGRAMDRSVDGGITVQLKNK